MQAAGHIDRTGKFVRNAATRLQSTDCAGMSARKGIKKRLILPLAGRIGTVCRKPKNNSKDKTFIAETQGIAEERRKTKTWNLKYLFSGFGFPAILCASLRLCGEGFG